MTAVSENLIEGERRMSGVRVGDECRADVILHTHTPCVWSAAPVCMRLFAGSLCIFVVQYCCLLGVILCTTTTVVSFVVEWLQRFMLLLLLLLLLVACCLLLKVLLLRETCANKHFFWTIKLKNGPVYFCKRKYICEAQDRNSCQVFVKTGYEVNTEIVEEWRIGGRRTSI